MKRLKRMGIALVVIVCFALAIVAVTGVVWFFVNNVLWIAGNRVQINMGQAFLITLLIGLVTSAAKGVEEIARHVGRKGKRKG